MGHQNHKMWGRGVRKFISFRMCLSLYDYQSKTSGYSNGLTYLKNRAATNQKHKIDSQKPKRREHKHKIKGNHQTTKRKKEKERNKEEAKNQLENKV